MRIVLDRAARLPTTSELVLTARETPTMIASVPEATDPLKRSALETLGVTFLPAEVHEGKVALPELLDDLGAKGIGTVMVEGGAGMAAEFLAEDLVDRLVLATGPDPIGGMDGVEPPVTPHTVPAGFKLIRESRFGADHWKEWVRVR
jgi:diaminohydroxyphosphoribosylaminopyrimidine deaminase / 5-amino-6-(5-phosphoribosylamino)uracil reductase